MTYGPFRRVSLLVGVLCLLAVAGGCAKADDARAARQLEIAIQDDPVFVNQNYFQRERGLRFARALGVTRIRATINWAYALPRAQARTRRKPRRPAYNLAGVDGLIDAAAAKGIRVHVTIAGPAPAWAAGNRKMGPVRPSGREFGAFAKLVATRFKGRVDRYSIWNEPNWRTWLQPNTGYYYRGLYTRGYAAIKKQDRAAKVLIGETSPYARKGYSIAPLAFLRQLGCVNAKYRRVRRCPRLQADGYAHHPYEFRKAPSFKYPGADNVTMGKLPSLTRALDRISRAGTLRKSGGGRMPVYLTEFAYFAGGHRALKASTRSRYLQQAFSIALKNPRVKSNLQYLLVSPPKRFPWAFFNTGLLSSRGAKYPQYRALERWYKVNRRKLKRPGRPIQLPPPVPAAPPGA